jgi:hypothetical protein
MVVLLAGLLALPTAQPVQADEEADVDITLWAEPSIYIARGEVQAYKLRIENRGDSMMAYARVRLPYDPAQLTLVDAQFDGEKDYVYRINEDAVTVHIEGVGSDSTRFAVLFFRVADNLPNGTAITMIADYDWEDKNGNYDLENRSNAAPVVVWDFNLTGSAVWMAVDPQRQTIGNDVNLFSDRFIPDERVTPIITLPDGSERRISEERQSADPNGRVWLHLPTGDLPPGSYQVRLEGEDSDLVAGGSFELVAP